MRSFLPSSQALHRLTIRPRALAVAWLCALLPATVLAAPPRKVLQVPAIEVAAQSPLQRAAKCYAATDLLCVVESLRAITYDSPADAAEGLRLLAFAYARLDRHAEACHTFAHWLMLSPQHRLERATTPPAVFEDYTAALLDVHKDELDLAPQWEQHPVLPAPAVTPSDLPRFAPPAASQRDRADNVAASLLVGGAYDLKEGRQTLPAPLPAAEVGLGLLLGPWQVGIGGGMRYATRVTCTSSAPPPAGQGFDIAVGCSRGMGLVLPFQARVSRLFAGDLRHGASLQAGIGGAIETGVTSPVASLGVRYTWHPAGSTVGLCAELRDDLDLGNHFHAPSLLLGACFRPARQPGAP